MNIIFIFALMATIILQFSRIHYWTQRALTAEAAIVRVEAEIARTAAGIADVPLDTTSLDLDAVKRLLNRLREHSVKMESKVTS